MLLTFGTNDSTNANGSLTEPPPSAPNRIGHKPKPQKQNQKS